jgi:hypothetical protein
MLCGNDWKVPTQGRFDILVKVVGRTPLLLKRYGRLGAGGNDNISFREAGIIRGASCMVMRKKHQLNVRQFMKINSRTGPSCSGHIWSEMYMISCV